MMQIARITVIMGIVLSVLTSCKTISDFLDKGEVVARVGESELMMDEILKVIPNGISADDSLVLAKQYIDNWVLDHVFLEVAESQLSPSELDVSVELESYRRSLLKYRYEQLYVNQRIDTLVSEDQIQEFYELHPDRFVLSRPVVKARFLSIQAESPTLKMIKKKMSSDDASEIMEADSMAFSSALKFTTWEDAWVDIAVLAKEFGADASFVMASAKQGWIEKTDTSGIMNVAFVADMIPAGKMAPQEYSAALIKDMIISARKQKLLKNLEWDLLEDARKNGKFEILK